MNFDKEGAIIAEMLEKKIMGEIEKKGFELVKTNALNKLRKEFKKLHDATSQIQEILEGQKESKVKKKPKKKAKSKKVKKKKKKKAKRKYKKRKKKEIEEEEEETDEDEDEDEDEETAEEEELPEPEGENYSDKTEEAIDKRIKDLADKGLKKLDKLGNKKQSKEPIHISPSAQKLVQAMKEGATQRKYIQSLSGVPFGSMGAVMKELEDKGIITRIGKGKYALANPKD